MAETGVTTKDHEDLAEVVGDALVNVAGICDTTWHDDMAMAAVLLKAGYRKVESV